MSSTGGADHGAVARETKNPYSTTTFLTKKERREIDAFCTADERSKSAIIREALLEYVRSR